MLTAFGKAARKWRIDRDMRLVDMSKQLGVSVSYLSAVETGRKALTPEAPIVEKLPPELRRIVYAEAIKSLDAERTKICARMRQI